MKQFYVDGDLETDGPLGANGSPVLRRYSVRTSSAGLRWEPAAIRLLLFSFGLNRLQSLSKDTANDASDVCSRSYDIASALHMDSYEAYTVLKPKFFLYTA